MNQQFFTILLVALFLLILGCQDQLTESDVQRIREQGITGPRGERGPQGPPGEAGSIELTDADLRTISAWVQDDLSRQATTSLPTSPAMPGAPPTSTIRPTLGVSHSPAKFEGRGDSAIRCELFAGPLTVSITHDGSDYFGVKLYDERERYELLVNQGEPYSRVKLVQVGDKSISDLQAGPCLIDVAADGNWTIEFSSPSAMGVARTPVPHTPVPTPTSTPRPTATKRSVPTATPVRPVRSGTMNAAELTQWAQDAIASVQGNRWGTGFVFAVTDRTAFVLTANHLIADAGASSMCV